MEKLNEFLNFENFITPKIVKGILLLAMILGAAGIILSLFAGILSFIVALIIVPIYILLLKVSFEFVMVIFKMKGEIEELTLRNSETNRLLRELIQVTKENGKSNSNEIM